MPVERAVLLEPLATAGTLVQCFARVNAPSVILQHDRSRKRLRTEVALEVALPKVDGLFVPLEVLLAGELLAARRTRPGLRFGLGFAFDGRRIAHVDDVHVFLESFACGVLFAADFAVQREVFRVG